jgi:hypothetical protein
MKTNFPNPEDLLNFSLTIVPDEGLLSHSTVERMLIRIANT